MHVDTASTEGFLAFLEEGAALVTRERTIRYANETLRSLLRRPSEELVGRALESFVAQDDRGELRRFHADLLEGRSSHRELLLRAGRGDTVPVSLRVTATAWGERAEAFVYAFRAVVPTASSAKALATLLELSPDAMLLADAGGTIVVANGEAERMFGYEPGDLNGRAVEILVPPRLRDRHAQHRAAYAQEPRVRPMGVGLQLHGVHRGGAEFPVEISLGPVHTEGGVLVVTAIRDSTERVRFQREIQALNADLERRVEERTRELARSNAELENFAYVASHDLQEPLRMVVSYTQLIGRRYKGRFDADADVFFDFAIDGATRMQELIRDLLAYSRVGSSGAELRPVAVATCISEALRNLHLAVSESQAQVTVDAMPTLNADARQLAQVFQNLIGNAIKFRGSAPPVVHVSAERSGAWWILHVRDNGLGIEPQYQERIFVIFQRLHAKTTYPGSGIGLAICKRIVERHGGEISVDSTLGAGSTFHVRLPALEKEPS